MAFREASVVGGGEFLMSTYITNKADEALRAKNVEKGSTEMAQKKLPGTLGQNINISTNMHHLNILQKKSFYRYEVVVYGIGFSSRRNEDFTVDFTLQARSDYYLVDRRHVCHYVFKAFEDREVNSTIGHDNCLFYDMEKCIYALKPMINIPKEGKTFDFNADEVRAFDEDLPLDFKRYRIKIAPAAENNFQFKLDFSHLSRDVALIDHTPEQFLDVVTAQGVFNRKGEFTSYSSSLFYLLKPGEHGFSDADLPQFKSNNSFLGVGINKHSRTVQGPNGIITNGLVVQMKKTPFHLDQDLFISEKVRAILGDRVDTMCTNEIKTKVQNIIKGLWVVARHSDNQQRFPIHSLSDSNANTQKMVPRQGGEPITILDYYLQRYNKDILYPNLPLLVRKKGDELSYFPMEFCALLDDQRVKGAQQTPHEIKDLIKKTAIPPSQTIVQTRNLKNSMQLVNDEHLRAAGIEFCDNPIQTEARVIPPPEVEFAHNSKDVPKLPMCTWKGLRYLIPAKVTKWAVIALSDHFHPISEPELANFVQMLQRTMAMKGMEFADPAIRVFPYSSSFNVGAMIKQHYECGFEFMMIIHPNEADWVHDDMKFFERKTEIITQGLNMGTVKQVLQKGQPLTLENIVNKMNVKMQGLNYALVTRDQELRDLFGKETLIIGFAMNRPTMVAKNEDGLNLYGFPPNGNGNGHHANGNGRHFNGANGNGQVNGNGNGTGTTSASHAPNGTASHSDKGRPTAPSVVGFSANIGVRHIFEFIGDFYFQPPLREENVDIVGEIVERCLKEFHAANKQFPRHLIIFRSGCSDGQFKKILEYEVPLILKAMQDLGCRAKITLMVVSKFHATRLFKHPINSYAKPSDQNIPPGTVVDKDIVNPMWTEFYLNSHSAFQGTARTPRYNLLLDENQLSADALQKMAHHLCFGHQIVYMPTSMPTPVAVATEYAKRGRNLFNRWANNGNGNNGLVNNFDDLTKELNYHNTEYLKKHRLNA